MKQTMFAGDIYSTMRFGDLEVVEYVNSEIVRVRFKDTGYRTTACAGHVRSGRVRDRLKRTVHGVGFIGDGAHSPYLSGKHSAKYLKWKAMLERCYNHKTQAKNPSYKGVTVCQEWHNFQNFGAWYDQNYIEGHHIDKDIKQRGVKDKIYSPDTCCFVTRQRNCEESSAKRYEFLSPLMVRVDIYNMAAFCRENGLSASCMSRTHSGVSSHHKGWTRA